MVYVSILLIGFVACELRLNQTCTDLNIADQCEDACLNVLAECLVTCELVSPNDTTCKMLCARDDADCIDACP